MSLLPTFSRRKRQAAGGGSDVYSYDEIPDNVRVQIVLILNKAIGPSVEGGGYAHSYAPGHEAYKFIVEALREEFGVFSLGKSASDVPDRELFQWMLGERDIDRLIDGVELTLKVINSHVRANEYRFQEYSTKKPDDAIDQFNERLAEAAIGYQFESGQIVRVDSKLIHKEIVLPALRLLSDKAFAAAEKEYLASHAAYRHGDYETCLVESAKAFESVLKVIAQKRGWPVAKTPTAKQLLDAAFSANFISAELQAEFSSLRGLLESAVPTIRNRMAAHGAGAQPRTVPEHLAAFQLHQTACAVVFLVDHDQATK